MHAQRSGAGSMTIAQARGDRDRGRRGGPVHGAVSATRRRRGGGDRSARPAGGASFGNAGLLSPDTAVPIALPGMLRKVPGWLTDPLGPLSVRPAYFPRALPWLLRWIEAGRLQRVLAISDAMRALHRESLGCWQELLGPALYRELIRPIGQVQVWEGEADTANAAVERQVRERHGIRAERTQRRRSAPDVSRHRTRGDARPAGARQRLHRQSATQRAARWESCSARKAAR